MTQHISSDTPIQYDPMWNQLRFAVYRLNYRVTTPMLLPAYKGSVFRGALGQQLTRISEEVSAKVFQTSQASWPKEASGEQPSPFLANLKEVPPPYVLEPPQTSQRFFEPGEMLGAHFILVGAAMDYLPFFVFAFSEAGRGGMGSWIDNRRGTCFLETIDSLHGWEDASPVVIYSGQEKVLSDESVILTLETIQPRVEVVDGCLPRGDRGSKQLEFLTPTRLKVKGHLTIDLSFDVLLRALMRRMSALAYYYCGMDLFSSPGGVGVGSPQSLLEAARSIQPALNTLEWFDWERHSKRQEATLLMGGFVGEIGFSGDLRPFEPFLRLGEFLHLGKGTSLGLGKYRIRERANKGYF